MLHLAQALAIRRIGQQEARGIARVHQLRQFTWLQVHDVCHAGALRIFTRGPNGLPITVSPENSPGHQRTARTLRIGCSLQAVPESRIVSSPTFETKPRSQQARRNIAGNERRFDDERATATQRVHEIAALGGDGRPAGAQQQTGSEVFLHGCGHAAGTITATMQRLASQIQSHSRHVF